MLCVARSTDLRSLIFFLPLWTADLQISKPFSDTDTTGFVMCRPRLRTALTQHRQRDRFVHLAAVKQERVRYIGRPTSATTATAAFSIHASEQSQIITEALTL
jgi:hypothetical protein